MILAARIDNQAAMTTPMLDVRESLDPFDVRSRSGPSKGDPEQIVQVTGGELGIIDDNDQREVVDFVIPGIGTAESSQVRRWKPGQS